MGAGLGTQVAVRGNSWRPAGGGPARQGLVQRASRLLGQALASDDAEAGGLRADEVLANPAVAQLVLGAPDAWPAARHAVVQRYGRVGALLVLGYEGRWRSRHDGGPVNPPEMEQLLDGFFRLDAEHVCDLLAGLEPADDACGHNEGATRARQWLHATYAVAARDGTDSAHRAYMAALDGVMRQAARRLAS